jgi:hypothetical protein
MTTGALLAEIAAVGGRIEVRGDRLRLTAPVPLPPELIARVRDAKPALLAALNEAQDWAARHREALAHWGVLHRTDEATWIAWGEMQRRWHRLYGERQPEGWCVGCRKPIGAGEAMALGDGNRAHLDDTHGLECLVAYSERWRGDATRALMKIGLTPPATGRG